MRRTHLKALLLVLITLPPAGTSAQKWVLRAGGGLTFMTLPKGTSLFSILTSPGYKGSQNSLTLAGSISACRRIISDHWYAGLRVSVASLRRYAGTGIQSNTGGSYNPDRKWYIYAGYPAIFLQPSGSYTYKGFYAGLQAGFIIYTGEGPSSRNSNRYSFNEFKSTSESFTGLAVGAHLGYQRRLIQRFGLFAELSCNYIRANINYQISSPAEPLSFFQPMGIVGIVYER